MKTYTKAELSAMRERWARSWADRQAAPIVDDITPNELARRTDERLIQRKTEGMRMAKLHRASQAAHAAAGDKDTARTLGLLAAHLEQSAALAEAERRDRAAKAKDHGRRVQAAAAASLPRPERRPAVRDRIIAMMAAEKATGTTFKTLLQRWEREPLDGLRLAETEPGRYTVEDENAEGVFGHYVTGTLQKLYSPKK
jgi:hypothetical protein